MALKRELAEALVRRHPARAAAVLEPLGPEAAADWMARLAPGEAASLLSRLAPGLAARVLARWPPATAARVLDALDLDVAVRLLRLTEEAPRAAALAALPPRRARAAGMLLRFAEGSAGALMDPDVHPLPSDLTVREARRRLREQPDQFRYNLYVVDREQRLVGVLTVRELWMARPSQRLVDVMVRDPLCLHANDDRLAVAAHPGWREVHALPVVDDAGAYLGAVRYRTLRAVEGLLQGDPAGDGRTADALAELFAVGASGLLEALGGAGSRSGGVGGR
jgi:Mg/Co/Ni transporter MgtE